MKRGFGLGRGPALLFIFFVLPFLSSCRTSLEECRERLARQPDDVQLHLDYARALADEEKIEEAIETYEAAVDLSGDLEEAYLPMARLYARLGLFDDVRVHGELMLWKDPESIEGHRLVGRALLSLDPARREEALEHQAQLRKFGVVETLRPFSLGEEESLMGRLRHRAETGPFIVRAVEKGLAEDLRRMVEVAWHRLRPIYGVRETGKRRVRVYVFETRGDYLSYAARHRPRFADYGGFYCSQTRKIVTYAIPEGGGKRRWLPRVLLHELSHAVMHMALGGSYGRGHPMWLDEGLADLHSTGWPKGRGFPIPGVDEVMLARARWFARKASWIPLRSFLHLSKIRTVECYAQAWSVVYWMKTKHPDWIEKMLQALRAHEDAVKVFEKEAGDLDVVDAKLRDWLQDL